MDDISGNGFHFTQSTDASRPTYQVDGNGNAYLDFDGTNDFMVTASVDLTATDKVTLFGGCYKESDAAVGMIIESSTSASSGTTFGAFTFYAPSGAAAANYLFGLKGSSSITSWNAATYAAPHLAVFNCVFDIGGAGRASEIRPTINGATPSLGGAGASAGTGNFGNYAVYIGRRGGTSFPFNGRIYPFGFIGKACTGGERLDTDIWCNARTNAY